MHRVKTTMMSLVGCGERKKSPFNFLNRSSRLRLFPLCAIRLYADNYLLHTFEFISHVRNIYHLTWHTQAHTSNNPRSEWARETILHSKRGKQIEEKCTNTHLEMMKRAHWMNGCASEIASESYVVSKYYDAFVYCVSTRRLVVRACECERG